MFLLLFRACQRTSNREGPALAGTLRTEGQVINQPAAFAAVVQTGGQIVRAPADVIANQRINVGIHHIDGDTNTHPGILRGGNGASSAPQAKLVLCFDVDRVSRYVGAAMDRTMYGTVDHADNHRAVACNARALARGRADGNEKLVLQRAHVYSVGRQAAIGPDTGNRLIVGNLDIEPRAHRTAILTGGAEQSVEVARNDKLF